MRPDQTDGPLQPIDGILFDRGPSARSSGRHLEIRTAPSRLALEPQPGRHGQEAGGQTRTHRRSHSIRSMCRPRSSRAPHPSSRGRNSKAAPRNRVRTPMRPSRPDSNRGRSTHRDGAIPHVAGSRCTRVGNSRNTQTESGKACGNAKQRWPITHECTSIRESLTCRRCNADAPPHRVGTPLRPRSSGIHNSVVAVPRV